MFFPFMKNVYLVEELDGSFSMVDSDPRAEDWEHIYRDVFEGVFYPYNENSDGCFFATRDDIDTPCFGVVNGTPSPNEPDQYAFEIRQNWEKIKHSLDGYISSHKKPVYYLEDADNFGILLNRMESSKLIRYADFIFVIRLSAHGLPLEVYGVLTDNGLEFRSIDSTT